MTLPAVVLTLTHTPGRRPEQKPVADQVQELILALARRQLALNTAGQRSSRISVNGTLLIDQDGTVSSALSDADLWELQAHHGMNVRQGSGGLTEDALMDRLNSLLNVSAPPAPPPSLTLQFEHLDALRCGIDVIRRHLRQWTRNPALSTVDARRVNARFPSGLPGEDTLTLPPTATVKLEPLISGPLRPVPVQQIAVRQIPTIPENQRR